MRLFFGFTFLILGLFLCAVHSLAIAFTKAQPIARYREQLKAFPVQEFYTRAELADAMWRVWTNRTSLPEQKTYSVEELKAGMLKTVPMMRDQAACDRALFEAMILREAGYRRSAESGSIGGGILFMVVGAFMLGGNDLRPAKVKVDETQTG